MGKGGKPGNPAPEVPAPAPGFSLTGDYPGRRISLGSQLHLAVYNKLGKKIAQSRLQGRVEGRLFLSGLGLRHQEPSRADMVCHKE